MKIRERAAAALDKSLGAASEKVGIHTDKARWALACWLDGAVKMKASSARAYCVYLEGVSR